MLVTWGVWLLLLLLLVVLRLLLVLLLLLCPELNEELLWFVRLGVVGAADASSRVGESGAWATGRVRMAPADQLLVRGRAACNTCSSSTSAHGRCDDGADAAAQATRAKGRWRAAVTPVCDMLLTCC